MIFVDADSCEKNAREFILNAAVKKNLNVIFAANKNIPFSFSNPLFKMEICSKEKNSADNFIAENSKPGDIVVTRDLILAQRILNKKISVMNDKGTVFNKENLEYLIEERQLSIQMKSLGVSTGGKWKNYSGKDFEKFKSAFSALLENSFS